MERDGQRAGGKGGRDEMRAPSSQVCQSNEQC